MALLNQSGLLFYDSRGDIHHFLHVKDVVEYTYWDHVSHKGSRETFCESIREIRGFMGQDDTIYLFCISHSDDMTFYEIKDHIARKKKIEKKDTDQGIRDIAIYASESAVYMLYTCEANRPDRRYGVQQEPVKLYEAEKSRKRLVRLSCLKAELKTQFSGFQRKVLLEFETGLLPSEVAVRQYGERTYITVIEKRPQTCGIIVLRQIRDEEVSALVKITLFSEIFWYDFCMQKGSLIFAYTVREEGMFSIKSLCYHPENTTLSEERAVREKSSCTHPSFVEYKGKTWLCWYEEGSVRSCVMEEGADLSGPVKWKETVGREIVLNEIFFNDKNRKEKYAFDFRRAFCIFPENLITGFSKTGR